MSDWVILALCLLLACEKWVSYFDRRNKMEMTQQEVDRIRRETINAYQFAVSKGIEALNKMRGTEPKSNRPE